MAKRKRRALIERTLAKQILFAEPLIVDLLDGLLEALKEAAAPEGHAIAVDGIESGLACAAEVLEVAVAVEELADALVHLHVKDMVSRMKDRAWGRSTYLDRDQVESLAVAITRWLRGSWLAVIFVLVTGLEDVPLRGLALNREIEVDASISLDGLVERGDWGLHVER